MSPIRAIFELVRDVPFARGAVAILLGLGFVYLARVLFYRASPPVTWRKRSDRIAYWFGRVLGVAILVLAVILIVLDFILLCLR